MVGVYSLVLAPSPRGLVAYLLAADNYLVPKTR